MPMSRLDKSQVEKDQSATDALHKEQRSNRQSEHYQPNIDSTNSYKERESIRVAEVFTPELQDSSDQLPQSITDGEQLPHIASYQGMRLESIPVKGLKSFAIGLAVLFAGLVGWEVFDLFRSALATHWSLAAILGAGLGYVAWQGMRSVFHFSKDAENYGILEALRRDGNRIRESLDYGRGPEMINLLTDFYAGKPQMVHLQSCLDSLPDYANDQEMLSHIEQHFLQPLDQEAQRRVSDFSLHTSLAVAASPWASLDMLLSLWRSMKMVDEVAQVYGMRPSIKNRMKLMKLVLHQMTFVGASELLIEHAMDDFGLNSFANAVSARIGQGLGAGIYSMKIGVAAMKVSRPFEFEVTKKPNIKQMIGGLFSSLKRQFGSKK
jgi:putative membrane protein